MAASRPSMPAPSSATVARVTAVVVLTVGALLLLWQVRGPVIWVLIAALIATALNKPVGALSRRMPRPLAITIVYVILVLIPIGILTITVPPLVGEAQKLIESLPELINDLQTAMQNNDRIRPLLADFDPLQTLKEQASTLASSVGDVASVIGSIGLGAVNSIVAGVTILILSVFFVSSGSRWVRGGIDLYGGERSPLYHRMADRTGGAIAAYFAGVLLIAFVAGVTAYIVMSLLGIPYATALGVFCALASLIPMFGATIAAVVVGLIAAVTTSWSVVLAWAVWQMVYQQLENNLVQPQIQKRTVKVPPVLTVVGVIFGSSLLGVLGAVIAIPTIAAAIALSEEWAAWKRGCAAARSSEHFDHASRRHAAATAFDSDRTT